VDKKFDHLQYRVNTVRKTECRNCLEGNIWHNFNITKYTADTWSQNTTILYNRQW